MRTLKIEWEIQPEPALHGYAIEWLDPGAVILSQRETLYGARTLQDQFAKLGSFPCARWKKLVTRFRPFQRLFRHIYYNVVKLTDGSLFLSFDKRIGIYKHGNIQPIHGLLRPCRILRSCCAVKPCGDVIFGEYLGNTERGPIRIYRYTPGQRDVTVVYTFPSGAIRHVHGIYADPYSEFLWGVTGDRGHECRILRFTDNFNHVETIGAGDESWRCVSLLFSEDAVYYATDSEFQQNRIYRLERKSGKREDLGEVDGPVYYSYKLGNDLFWGVTAELSPGQRGSVHKGQAASLWHVDKDNNIQKLFSCPKDRFSAKYFMPGTLHFPNGRGLPGVLYVYGVGLQGFDNCTYKIKKK